MKILYKYQNEHDLLIHINLFIYKHTETHNIIIILHYNIHIFSCLSHLCWLCQQGCFPMSFIQTRSPAKAHWGFLQAACPAAFMQNWHWCSTSLGGNVEPGTCEGFYIHWIETYLAFIPVLGIREFYHHNNCVLANFLIISLNKGKLILNLFFSSRILSVFPLPLC